MPEILSIGELLDMGTAANMSAYIRYSGLEYNASGAMSGISGSAIAGGIESSVVSSIVSSMVSGKADLSAVEDCCSAMSAEVSAKLDATASSLFQPSGNYMPSGDYVFESSYSSFTSEVTNNITSISSTVSGLTGDYLEKSASSMFAPSGEYAYESSLSSYIPQSSSGQFAPSGDYADASALSSYIPYSAVAGESNQITSINGSAIAGGGGGIDSATCSAIASSYAESAVSGKLDASASSQFYLNSNPSGFLTSQVVTAVAGDYGFVTSINGSGLSGQGGGSTPSYTETQLIINSSNMTASTSTAGITIGVKVPVQIVSNSSQATGVNIVYIVTG